MHDRLKNVLHCKKGIPINSGAPSHCIFRSHCPHEPYRNNVSSHFEERCQLHASYFIDLKLTYVLHSCTDWRARRKYATERFGMRLDDGTGDFARGPGVKNDEVPPTKLSCNEKPEVGNGVYVV